jgi:DNA-directed RNA polymerase specialized sigma24 family protein
VSGSLPHRAIAGRAIGTRHNPCHGNPLLDALFLDVTIPDATDAIGAAVSDFPTFFGEAEPRLRRALVSRYGHDAGREATAAALAWGFEHWSELRTMTNPTGYLYRVGCSRTRPRKRRALFDAPVQHEPLIEPGLRAALERLTPNQRTAVVLVTAFDWKVDEVAALMDVSLSTVNTHMRRGLAVLRKRLGVELP